MSPRCTSRGGVAHGRLEMSGHPGSRRPLESGSHPDDPARHCARGHRRGFNNLRALAQNRRETGSLETAPTATQSPRCSHSGIAPGLTAVFSLYVGRFRRSREKRRRNEGRPRRGGSRSAGDRLASRVSWSGVGAPGIPARGRRMVDRTSARPNAVARVSQQGGWTHYWCIARNGSWVLKRKTAKDRLRRSLTAVNRWCCTHRHESIAKQHRMLGWKLRGHCAYFGIRGNASSLTTFGFPRRAHLAKVAQPSVAAEVNAVDAVPPSSRAISSSADDGRSLRHRSIAKPSAEEPDAEEPARPDLWGARVSNDPGLPDRSLGPCERRCARLRSPWRADRLRVHRWFSGRFGECLNVHWFALIADARRR